MKRIALLAAGGLAAAGLFAARPSAAQQQPAAASTRPVGSGGDTRTIELPTIKTDLPPAPGRETVAAGCILCHSHRYILNQPKFPRATWVAEVDKMRKTYGAPLTDAQAAEAVNYLAAVRGVDEPGVGK